MGERQRTEVLLEHVDGELKRVAREICSLEPEERRRIEIFLLELCEGLKRINEMIRQTILRLEQRNERYREETAQFSLEKLLAGRTSEAHEEVHVT
jgi:hypothetical protein